MQKVAKERTGWRDLALSQRHRLWGLGCPATDIDFLLIEYDPIIKGRPVALLEFKHERAMPQYPSKPTIQALIQLGTNAGIPVFAVRYKSDWSNWKMIPLNQRARIHLPKRIDMTERELVTFLYGLRGLAPKNILFNGNYIREETDCY